MPEIADDEFNIMPEIADDEFNMMTRKIWAWSPHTLKFEVTGQ